MSGYAENFCDFGAEPSNGGKGVVMGSTLLAAHYCEGVTDASAPDHERSTAAIDAIERDLADVEAALNRLDNGSYWNDEVTGQPLSDDLLARRPLARRNES